MTSEPYTALDLAVLALHEYESKGKLITNLDLQKILYLLWGAYYSVTHKILFYEEFVAWKTGPAIEEVWDRYRRFIATPILSHDPVRPHPDGLLIKGLIDYFSQMDLMEIWKMARDAPWEESYSKGRGTVIGRNRIRRHLSEKL